MAQSLLDQLARLLAPASRHLILLPEFSEHIRLRSRADLVASAVGLARLIRLHNVHTCDIVADRFVMHKAFSFIPEAALILPAIPARTTHTLTFTVEPSTAPINPSSIITDATQLQYDTIWILGAHDRQALGRTARDHHSLLDHTPTVVIDTALANDRFGAVNLIDPTAASLSEIIGITARELAPAWYTPENATLMLTGIIGRTHSFRSHTMNERTFQLVANLIQDGASREIIVDHLFRQRSIALLRLWGEVLTRMQHDATSKFATIMLTPDVFASTGCAPEWLGEITDEILASSPEINLCVVVYTHPEHREETHILATSTRRVHVRETLAIFGATGNATVATARIMAPLQEVHSRVHAELIRSLVTEDGKW
jgi:bifunctional oligoribonuclease and PAP phosphatase NrnA